MTIINKTVFRTSLSWNACTLFTLVTKFNLTKQKQKAQINLLRKPSIGKRETKDL